MRLEYNGVSAVLGGRRILEGLRLFYGPGIHVVLGPNGSGKSTLLKLGAGLIQPAEGEVLIDGVSISSYKRSMLARIIGYCWQNPLYGFFEETVRREIEFILRNTGTRARWDIVEILGIGDLLDRNPFKLSGGEAKRVSLASVLIADQPVLLLDEPFSGLDYHYTISLIEYLKRERDRGKTILVATHNILLAEKLDPQTYTLLRRGRAFQSEHGFPDQELAETGVIPRSWWVGNTI